MIARRVNRVNAGAEAELAVPLSALISLASLSLHPIMVQVGTLPSPAIRYPKYPVRHHHLFISLTFRIKVKAANYYSSLEWLQAAE